VIKFAFGPKVNCVRKGDFDERVELHRVDSPISNRGRGRIAVLGFGVGSGPRKRGRRSS